jgi:hypothetical protein
MIKKEREDRGLWTAESAAIKHKEKTDALQTPDEYSLF